MPDLSEMYDRPFFNTTSFAGYLADLGVEEVTLTVTSVKIEQLHKPGKKGTEPEAVIRFADVEKGLIVNPSIFEGVAALYGPVSEDWVGKRIVLYLRRGVGGPTDAGIRVKHVRLKSADAPIGVNNAQKFIARCRELGRSPEDFVTWARSMDRQVYEHVHGREVEDWGLIAAEPMLRWLRTQEPLPPPRNDRPPLHEAAAARAAAAEQPARRPIQTHPDEPAAGGPDYAPISEDEIPF